MVLFRSDAVVYGGEKINICDFKFNFGLVTLSTEKKRVVTRDVRIESTSEPCKADDPAMPGSMPVITSHILNCLGQNC